MKEMRFGKVTKYFEEKGFGFIRCGGSSYFVHRSNLQDVSLKCGDIVDFNIGVNKKTGKEQAVDVIVVER